MTDNEVDKKLTFLLDRFRVPACWRQQVLSFGLALDSLWQRGRCGIQRMRESAGHWYPLVVMSAKGLGVFGFVMAAALPLAAQGAKDFEKRLTDFTLPNG